MRSLSPVSVLTWTFVLAVSGLFYYGVYVVIARIVAGM